MRHHVPRPGLQATAFSATPIVSAYERRLSAMTPIDFAIELDVVVAALRSEDSGANLERLRLYRREMARRLFRSAS